jgi:hypothetical protein
MESIQKSRGTFKQIGQIIFWIAIASTILVPLFIMLCSNPDAFMKVRGIEYNLESLATGERVILSLMFILMPLVIAFGAYHFYKLFALYEKGIIFTKENIQHFNAIGATLILWWFVGVFIDLGRGLIGQHNGISISSFQPIIMLPTLIGATIIQIGRVMDEGRKLREEQELTV